MTQILVVDDDPKVRWFCRSVLQHAGYVVAEAPNGRAALAALREGPAELLLCDVFMPEMDGIETILQLQRHGHAPKIIAMSGGGSHLDRQNVLKIAGHLGAVRVLEKPFTADVLLDAVGDVLAAPDGGLHDET